MLSTRLLEGLAREAHEATGLDAPVDACALATACGLALRPGPGSSARLDLERLVIVYGIRPRQVRLHGLIAHELAHYLLWRAMLDHLDEEAAQYLAGALLLPRERFLADLAATDWDLFTMQLRHPNASAQMIVVRMTQVSAATASVWDAGRLHRVYGDHDVDAARRLVDLVLQLEEPVELGAARAYPVIDGRWRRVLVVRRAA